MMTDMGLGHSELPDRRIYWPETIERAALAADVVTQEQADAFGLWRDDWTEKPYLGVVREWMTAP